MIEAAEAAWREGRAPLASVEGFIRQVLGWREYVRGLYWQHMPEWLEWNALEAGEDLPGFYWTGETDMRCLAETLGQTLKLGYAHHIQRLMVTGLFAQLLGVRPRALHEWYLAVYVDAVEWVELPNTLGMSQYTDGGRMASKPYVASGQYIKRMSNYCEHCRYRPDETLGEQACPFTTLYWDFLDRHRARFSRHPRTALQWRNLDRLSPSTWRPSANRLRTSAHTSPETQHDPHRTDHRRRRRTRPGRHHPAAVPGLAGGRREPGCRAPVRRIRAVPAYPGGYLHRRGRRAGAGRLHGGLRRTARCPDPRRGQHPARPLHRTDEDTYRQTLAANLDSAFFTLRAYVQAALKAKRPGKVVLVSSVVARVGVSNHEAIAMAKGGIEALVRSAAATYSPRASASTPSPRA